MNSIVPEILTRFIIGGVVVSAFAVIGDIVRPKSFAGIFGAAPSIATAALGIAFFTHGASYTSLEGRSMVAGAVALLIYSLVASRLLMNRTLNTVPAVAISMVAWFTTAFGLWGVFLR